MYNVKQLRESLEYSVDERNAASLSPIMEAVNVAFLFLSIDVVAWGTDRSAAFHEVVDVFLEMSRLPKRFDNMVAEVCKYHEGEVAKLLSTNLKILYESKTRGVP